MRPLEPFRIHELETIPSVPAQRAAATVARTSDAERRRLIWYLHWASHQEGGLTGFAVEMLELILKQRLGTPTMRAAGIGAGVIYTGETYNRICDEIDSFEHRSRSEIERELETCEEFRPYDAAERIAKLRATLRPERRRANCWDLLQVCRERCRDLPQQLRELCINPEASWTHPHFEGFVDALRQVIERRAATARARYASTRIAGYVQDVMSFAYRNRSLAVIHGTERLGKSVAARLWQETNAGCARLIDLTAATTDILFYQEVFKALGCGEVRRGDANELRAGIRAAVETRDLMLIFDEAHCLFGLSARASIKRLEYIRTEFVNRGIPVVLVVTPQFSERLREMERTTGFNTNQFRGRITKWAELPEKPSRADVECVCRHMIPGLSDEAAALLVDCAVSADTPLAALNNAVLEARMLAERRELPVTHPEVIRTAIGYSLATRQMLEASIPAPQPAARRRRAISVSRPAMPATNTPETPDAASVHAPRIALAKEVPAQPLNRGQAPLCVT